MIRNLYTRLVLIVVILATALWVDLSDKIVIYNPFNDSRLVDRDVTPRLGLDLRGGLQVLLEADVPQNAKVDAESMQTARTIMENRTNALGVSENVLQIAGERRIVGEFPGLEDADAVLATIQQTGLLEFVDTGDVGMDPGMVIQTDFATGSESEAAPTTEGGAEAVIYHTVMTGKDLKQVLVTQDQLGDYIIQFELTSEGAKVFAEHTAANIQRYLTIVLDKQVISSPVIQSEIPDGQGIIQGNFTAESANALAVQLRYGSLPVPLKVVETRIIGPTLGEDSLQKSLRAGLVGMIVVMLFMAIYYRLPGLVADLSILFYAAIAFAIFKYFHFTLTLPGIAGFLLSVGMAVDGNVVIFERLKEEIKWGKTLVAAMESAFHRAWIAIFDGNMTTIIAAVVLWFLGTGPVKGFAITLMLGNILSLFSAVFVTRHVMELLVRQ